MKVAYITSQRSGLESFILDEMLEYKRLGFDINILSFYSLQKFEHAFVKSNHLMSFASVKGFLFSLLYIITNPLRSMATIKRYADKGLLKESLIAFSFLYELRNEKVNLIQCHFGDSKFFVGMIMSDLGAVPVNLVVHAHELYANTNEKAFRYFLHRVHRIETISEKNKSILVNNFGLSSEDVVIKRLAAGRHFNDRDAINVLTVCRFTERKGINELLDAAAMLRDEKFHFTIIGWGTIDVQAEIARRGLSSNVTVYDRMDSKELSYFYRTADVFCLPSKTTKDEGSEGIPVVIMEALQSKLPVIATDNGSIDEILPGPYLKEGCANSIVEHLKHKTYLNVNWEEVFTAFNKKYTVKNYADNIGELLQLGNMK